MATLKEHLEHRSGLRIPIPKPVDDGPTGAGADGCSLLEAGRSGVSRSKSNPGNATGLTFGSFDALEGGLRFAAGGAQQLIFDKMPVLASARSALSTPGSQQANLPVQEDKSVPHTALRAAASAPPEQAANVINPSGSTKASPLFEEHSGFGMATGNSNSGDDRRASSGDPSSTAVAREDGWATVPPHRLSTQLQLCLRHAFGATASAEQVVLAAPAPYRSMSRVRAMDENEYGAWVVEVERAWYGKLRTMLPWRKHAAMRDGGRDSGAPQQQQQKQPQQQLTPQRAPTSASPPPPPQRWPSAPASAGFAVAGNTAAAAYGVLKGAGEHGTFAAGSVHGTQSYYHHHHHAAAQPLQPVIIGPMQPTPMGPMHPVIVPSPMQPVVVASPFMSTHASAPVPMHMVVVPPMMSAVGGPYGMGGGAFQYMEGGGILSAALGHAVGGGYRRGQGQQYGRLRNQQQGGNGR